MKYCDLDDNEIDESQIDYDLGHIIVEERVIAIHEAVEAEPAITHFEVKTFYFEDGTSYDVQSQDDPHIDFIDPDNGVFGYIDQGENKELRGIDLETIVEKEAVEPQEAWEEKEEFYRYIPFTEEELAIRKEAQEKAIQQTAFLETGPDRLNDTETTVENLGVDVGDLSVTLVEILENL